MQGLAVREEKVMLSGVRIWFRLLGEGPATPVVVIHGGPGMPHHYMEPFAFLADRCPVLFYDQVDCGSSERPGDPARWTIDYFVDELLQLCHHLGFERVYLAGHSWGAILATQAALSGRLIVESMMLVSPCFSVPRLIQDMVRLKGGLPESIQRIFARHEQAGTTRSVEYRIASMTYYQAHMCRTLPFPAPLQAAFEAVGEAVYRHMWGDAETSVTGTLKNYECLAELKRLHMPVLLMCGRNDETTPETTASYQHLIERAALVVFEHSAHFLHLEEPQRFRQVVLDFMDSIQSPGSVRQQEEEL